MPTIFRVSRTVDNPWVQVHRDTARDTSLSFAARGMLLFILSHPDDWTCTNADLEAASPLGRDGTARIIRELRQAGYMHRRRVNDNGRGVWATLVFELPVLSPGVPSDTPLPGTPTTGKPPMATPLPDTPTTGKPVIYEQEEDSSSLTNVREEGARRAARTRVREGALTPAPSACADSSPSSTHTKQDTPHQLLFGAICEACGFDTRLMAAEDRSNAGKLATTLLRQGVTPEMVGEAWAAERDRIAGFADGRPVSSPGVKRLTTLIGAYRKRIEAGNALGAGRYRDPETGAIVVNMWEVR